MKDSRYAWLQKVQHRCKSLFGVINKMAKIEPGDAGDKARIEHYVSEYTRHTTRDYSKS